jgi:hypothetical protein
LVVVPPSLDRPHTVRITNGVRYPRRHGTTTHWLSEGEIADAYRSRFQVTDERVDRLAEVLDDGLEGLQLIDEDEVRRALAAAEGSDAEGEVTAESVAKLEPWLVIGLVPSAAGAMAIDAARLGAIEAWA